MKTKGIADCEAIRAQLTAYLLGEIRAAEKEMVRSHLEACEVCRAEAHRLKQTLDAVRAALADPEIAPPVPARLSPDRRARLIEYATRRPRRIPFRFWIALEAAAAILIVGLVSGILVLPRRSPPREDLIKGHRDSIPQATLSKELSPIQGMGTTAPAPSALAKGPIYFGAPVATDALPHDRVEKEYARKAEITAPLPREHEAAFLAQADPLEFDASKRPENGSAGAAAMRERLETAAAAGEEPMTDLALTADDSSVSLTAAAPTAARSAAREPALAARRALRDMPAAPAMDPAEPLVDACMVPSPFRSGIHWLHLHTRVQLALQERRGAGRTEGVADGREAPLADEVILEVRFNPRRVAWWQRFGNDRRTAVSESDGEEIPLTTPSGVPLVTDVLYKVGLVTTDDALPAAETAALAAVTVRRGRTEGRVVFQCTVTDQHHLQSFATAGATTRLGVCTAELMERLLDHAHTTDAEWHDLAKELRRLSVERPFDEGIQTMLLMIEDRYRPLPPAKADDR